MAAGFGSIAIGVLVLSMAVIPPAGLLIAGILAVTAIVCGAMGFNREGKGMAIAGFCMGLGAIVVGTIAVALLIAFALV